MRLDEAPDVGQVLATLISLNGARPDHPVEIKNLLFEPEQFYLENCDTSAGYFRHSLITWISDDIE